MLLRTGPRTQHRPALFAAFLVALAGCREPVLIGNEGGAGAAGSPGTGDPAGGGGGGGSGAGTTTGSTDGQLFPDPPEGSFPCGPQGYCMKDSEYCLTKVPGVCCSDGLYSCEPLPEPCKVDGAGCGCFDGQPCPCGELACEDPLTSAECAYDAAATSYSFVCAYP